MAMDKACEDDETRACVTEAGFTPVAPPKETRKEPWDYDKELYKRRNEVERLFRKLKAVRRISRDSKSSTSRSGPSSSSRSHISSSSVIAP